MGGVCPADKNLANFASDIPPAVCAGSYSTHRTSFANWPFGQLHHTFVGLYRLDTYCTRSTAMQQHETPNGIFGDPIHVYTRAKAIADGNLIDVTDTAREAGFRVPVAITAAAWADCVAWSAEDSRRQTSQDQAGRLWDVLWIAFLAARGARGARDLLFPLYRIERGGHGIQPARTKLRLTIGPGDDPAPVITILMHNED
jgi:hypothetical protein